MATIEGYAFSDGSSAFRALNSLVIEEAPSSPATTTARLAASAVFSDALDLWRAILDATTPAGLWSITYSATTRRVTIASTNATNFRPVFTAFDADLARWLGFDPAGVYGFALSHTGTAVPHGRADVLGVDVEPPEDAAQVEVQQFRLGRAIAPVFGNHLLQRVLLTATARQCPTDWCWLTTGRVRVYPTADVNPYSVANLDGYHDGYVTEQPTWQHEGDAEEVRELGLTLAVARE